MCEGCRSLLRPAAPGSPLAAYVYGGPARAAVLSLKLRSRRDHAAPLIEGMLGVVRRAGVIAEVVTWVPARASDKRRRGSDHAEVLARGVAAGLGLPARALLQRMAASQDQAGLGKVARSQNLVGVFAARPCNGRILLVDDLCTTGATLAACTGALRASGADGVEAVVACKA